MASKKCPKGRRLLVNLLSFNGLQFCEASVWVRKNHDEITNFNN